MTPHLPGPKALQVTSMLVQRCQLHIQGASAATLHPVQTQPSLKAKEAERQLLPPRLRLIKAHHRPPCTASNACRTCTHQPHPPISQCQHATAHCPGTTAGSHAGTGGPYQVKHPQPCLTAPSRRSPCFQDLAPCAGHLPSPPHRGPEHARPAGRQRSRPPTPPTDSPGPGQRLGRLRRGSQRRLLPEDHPAGRAGRAAAAAARLLLPHLLRTLLFCSLPADGTKSRGCHGHLSH